MSLRDMSYPQREPTCLSEDNVSCMKFIENEKKRITNVDVKMLKQKIQKHELKFQCCPSEQNGADI